MKLGLQLANEYLSRQHTKSRVEALLEQVAVARDYGFDGIFAGQHFLSAPLQMIQPIPLLARLSAEAGDMRLGTGILLVPLFHPVDMAEQIATLDTICNGRFIFGVGLGYEEEEFQAFDIPRRDRVGRFEESLEIIKLLWTEDSVTFEGDYFTLRNVVPTARPMQKPYPPIWIAANNHPAVRRAARMGDAWYANPHAVFSTLEEQMGIYKQAISESGAPIPEYVPILKPTYIAETTEAAFGECRPFLEQRYQIYTNQGQDEELPHGDRFDKPFEELATDRLIIGDPALCVEELKRYEAAGFNYVVMEIQWGAMDNSLAMKCLHLLGSEVLPKIQ